MATRISAQVRSHAQKVLRDYSPGPATENDKDQSIFNENDSKHNLDCRSQYEISSTQIKEKKKDLKTTTTSGRRNHQQFPAQFHNLGTSTSIEVGIKRARGPSENAVDLGLKSLQPEKMHHKESLSHTGQSPRASQVPI